MLPITEDGGIIHHQTSNVYAVLQIHSLSKLALGPDPNLLGLDFFALECRLVLGYAYPAYDCYKALELNTPQMEQLRFWCQYWYADLSSIQIYLQNHVLLHVNLLQNTSLNCPLSVPYRILVAFLTALERFADCALSWLPMYSEAKLALVVYLWHPSTTVSQVAGRHHSEHKTFFFCTASASGPCRGASLKPFLRGAAGRGARLRRLPPPVPGGARGGHRPRPPGAEGPRRGRDGVAPPGGRGARAGGPARRLPPRFVAAAAAGGDRKPRRAAAAVTLPAAAASCHITCH